MDAKSRKKRSCLDATAEREIRIRVAKLVKSHLFEYSDYDEIIQDLRIKVWKVFDFFDESRASWKTYLNKVLDRRVSQLIANQTRKRRRENLTEPIDEIIAKEIGNKKVPDFFVSKNIDERFAELNISIAQLDAELQEICELLMEYNVAEVAKILGISRGSLRNKISKIGNKLKK